jgi:hypothetical protein
MCQVITRSWPDTAPLPAPPTLWKWLDQAVHEGYVLKTDLKVTSTADELSFGRATGSR